MRSPRRTPLDALVASPLTVTSPALIIRATCDREYSGARRADTKTSSRMPVQLLSAVMVAPALMAPGYFTTESPRHQDGGARCCLAASAHSGMIGNRMPSFEAGNFLFVDQRQGDIIEALKQAFFLKRFDFKLRRPAEIVGDSLAFQIDP